MTKLHKTRIQKWVNALRGTTITGEKLKTKYKQTTGALKDQAGFCCLGVACDIFAKDNKKARAEWCDITGVGVDRPAGYENFSIQGVTQCSSFLPSEVMIYFGLDDIDPMVLFVNNKKKKTEDTLSSLNDAGTSFAKIATIIEKTFLLPETQKTK